MNLNKEQKYAAEFGDGSCLILAGAGTGKTATLVARIIYLLQHGVSEESILLLTFTNKAAHEMKSRIEKEVGRITKITACTYHSFCVLMLRKYANHIGISNDFQILSQAENNDLIHMSKVKLGLEKQKGFPFDGWIAGKISESINKGLDLYDLVVSDSRYDMYADDVCNIRDDVDFYKSQYNYLNFDDLLVKFRDLLFEQPDICDKIERQYQYIMVDEYQDTNTLQQDILLKLRTYNPNLMVVGDDCQALYAFRGANVHNIIDFSNTVPNCESVTLYQNYRSNQEILDVANYAVNHHMTEGYKKTLHGQHEKHKKPYLVKVDDEADEVKFIVRKIIKKLDEGIPAEEICVLARTSSQLYKLEATLNKKKIPYKKYGGLKFTEKEVIMDLIAFLKVISNPYDEIAWFRVLKLHFGIGDTYALRISKECKLRGYDALVRNERRNYVPYLLELKKHIDGVKSDSLQELIRKTLNYYYDVRRFAIAKSRMSEDAKEEALYDLDNSKVDSDVFLDMSFSYNSIISFLDDLALDANPQLDNTNGVSEPILLSTIHSAKGLEFDTVFIMNCVDGLVASDRADYNDELRCFYVAITRAKNDLYFMKPKVMVFKGDIVYCSLVKYLDGADNLLETIYG